MNFNDTGDADLDGPYILLKTHWKKGRLLPNHYASRVGNPETSGDAFIAKLGNVPFDKNGYARYVDIPNACHNTTLVWHIIRYGCAKNVNTMNPSAKQEAFNLKHRAIEDDQGFHDRALGRKRFRINPDGTARGDRILQSSQSNPDVHRRVERRWISKKIRTRKEQKYCQVESQLMEDEWIEDLKKRLWKLKG